MEEELERALGEKGRELQAALEDLRVREFSYKVGELRCSLPSLNRCIICTLHLPCKHFSSVSEMPSPPSPIKENYSFQSYTKNLDVSDIMPQLPKPEPNNFKIRFRGKETKFALPTQQRAVSLPNAKKLKLIEKIETYREEKIRKEIQKIQEMKECEIKQKKEMMELEAARKNHAARLKEKLSKYKEELQARNEMLKKQMNMEEFNKRREEEKRKKYLEEKKKELEAFYEKKKILEKISKQKVKDLEQEVVGNVRNK
jgi:hypothetical protein